MVEVYGWNPVRPRFRGPIGRRIPIKRAVNNFGDLIGPLVVRLLLERRGVRESAGSGRRLLSVGSVLHFAHDGDTVWDPALTARPLRTSIDGRLWM